MKHKSTLILLIAVAVAGAVAYSLSRRPSSEELAEQRKRLLPEFTAGGVVALTIEEGESRIVCRREEDGGWRVVEPVDARADRWEVAGILDKLEMAEKVSSVYSEKGKPVPLAPYGLDQPVRTVSMKEGPPGEREWTVLIGKAAGAGEAAFVAVEGRAGVWAVPKDVTDRTAVTANDLRSKRLAERISVVDLKRLAVSARPADGQPPVELTCEQSNDAWELTRPLHDLADAANVRELVSSLYDHRIGPDEFVADDAAKSAQYGLDDPSLTLSLEGAGEEQTFHFAQRGDDWFAMHVGEPAIVRVPASLVQGLRAEPSELRDRRLARFTPEDVAEVLITGTSGELRLEKSDGAWRMTGDRPAAADGDIVDRILRELKDAEVRDFVADAPDDLGAFGLQEGSRLALSLYDDDAVAVAELSFGRDDEDGTATYVLRGAYPAVVSVEAADCVATLRRGRLALLDRLVLEAPASEATEVLVERAEGRFRCTYDSEDGRWRLAEPVRGKADHWAVQSIVNAFGHLRAEGFATEDAQDLKPFGLDPPRIVVRVLYGDEEGPAHELQVGAPAQPPLAGRYARLHEGRRVLALPDYVASYFEANLASKDICRADELVALSVHCGEETRRFAYDEQQSVWRAGDGGELDEAAAEAVKEAVRLLRNFRAAGLADYVSKGPGLYGFDSPTLVVTLDEKTTAGKQVVVGSQTEGGDYYAKGPATGFVHLAGAADVAKLQALLGGTALPAAEGTDEAQPGR